MLFLSLIEPPKGRADNFCKIANTTTYDGESVNYTVYYKAAGIYVKAGSASFTTKVEKLNGRPVFHIVSEGRSNSSYDWIYKVRDFYETYIDTVTMQPIKFRRRVEEGSTKKSETILFNQSSNTVKTDSGTFKVPACVQDVLSMIYFARNVNFSQYKKNDKIPYSLFLENEVHNLYIRYMGKEEVKTKSGKYNAIRFKPLLVPGTLFNGGEEMTVWVTDDRRHVPVRIESPILIGSIQVHLNPQ